IASGSSRCSCSTRTRPPCPRSAATSFDSLITSLTFTALGAVLLHDDFSDPSASLFRNPRSDHFDINYVDGAAIFSLYCRRSATAGSYRGMFDLFRSAVRVERTHPNASSDVLLGWTRFDAFQVGIANRAELACHGSQIDL